MSFDKSERASLFERFAQSLNVIAATTNHPKVSTAQAVAFVAPLMQRAATVTAEQPRTVLLSARPMSSAIESVCPRRLTANPVRLGTLSALISRSLGLGRGGGSPYG